MQYYKILFKNKFSQEFNKNLSDQRVKGSFETGRKYRIREIPLPTLCKGKFVVARVKRARQREPRDDNKPVHAWQLPV